MNHPYNRSAVNATAVVVTFTALVFVSFISFLLLKYVLYENGSFSSNVFLVLSVFGTRYYLLVTNKSLRTHEKACLFLFVLHDKNLLDFYNVFLLLGVESIRQQLHQSYPLKELISFAIGLVFLLMGWFSVGRVLVIYNLSMLLLLPMSAILVIFQLVIDAFFGSQSNNRTNNERDEVN